MINPGESGSESIRFKQNELLENGFDQKDRLNDYPELADSQSGKSWFVLSLLIDQKRCKTVNDGLLH